MNRILDYVDLLTSLLILFSMCIELILKDYSIE